MKFIHDLSIKTVWIDLISKMSEKWGVSEWIKSLVCLNQKRLMCIVPLYWNSTGDRFFTARIRRMGEGDIFNLSVHTRRGVPQSQILCQVSGPRPFSGATQSQVLSQVIGPRSFLEVPQDRGSPWQGLGYPHPWSELVYPPGQDRGTSPSETGYAAGGMPRAVSHRWTFLLLHFSRYVFGWAISKRAFPIKPERY